MSLWPLFLFLYVDSVTGRVFPFVAVFMPPHVSVYMAATPLRLRAVLVSPCLVLSVVSSLSAAFLVEASLPFDPETAGGMRPRHCCCPDTAGGVQHSALFCHATSCHRSVFGQHTPPSPPSLKLGGGGGKCWEGRQCPSVLPPHFFWVWFGPPPALIISPRPLLPAGCAGIWAATCCAVGDCGSWVSICLHWVRKGGARRAVQRAAAVGACCIESDPKRVPLFLLLSAL